jgi:hypothetical protein
MKEERMHYRAMFRGDYIAAVELPENREVTRTIREVRLVQMESEDGVSEKPVCFFAETHRGWVLNRTNAECLAGMFGEETSRWQGKRVTLYRTTVQLGRERVPGIRVAGSPDIDRDITVKVKLPRRKPQPMTMRRTGDESPDGPRGGEE